MLSWKLLRGPVGTESPKTYLAIRLHLHYWIWYISSRCLFDLQKNFRKICAILFYTIKYTTIFSWLSAHVFGAAAPVEVRRLKSAFQRDDSTASFHHHARRHSPSLLLCFFYKAWPTDPIGSSQEPRLHATIAIWGSVSSAQLCCCSVCIEFPGRKTAWDVWLHMILKEDVTTYQERLGSYLK